MKYSLSSVGLMIFLFVAGLYLLIFPQGIEKEMIETSQQCKYIGFIYAPLLNSKNGLRFLGLVFLGLVYAIIKRFQIFLKVFTALYATFIISLLIAFYDKTNTFQGQKQSEGLQRTAIHLLIFSVFLNSLEKKQKSN